MAPPVALITGASSGIGLALTNHLLSQNQNWHVVMLDLNPPPPHLGTSEQTLFIRTNIASWSSQSTAFATAYAWHNRLDFIALNAGTDDRDDIFTSLTLDPLAPPRKPNMLPLDVNLTGTYYGLKLSAHYLTLPSSGVGKPLPGGKIVVTASAAGLRALPNVPQYTASKHALVGLVRALAPQASWVDVAINAHCPALVATGLAPEGLLERFGEGEITPMETILRCYDELADLQGIGEEGWVKGGLRGKVVEGTLGELVWHEEAGKEEERASYVNEEGLKAWTEAYGERNRRFAQMDWEKEAE